jgi:histidyl-tRNA synthetase
MSENKDIIQRVTGTRDVTPGEYERRQKASKILADAFERFGYCGVEVPILEKVDLHLRKSGEAIRKNMYFFQDQGQENICLRPELTASVARMFNKELNEQPLPVKLYYQGSAFRYDRPQTGRYREFTQAGVELIGGRTPDFDAEVIACACHAMDSLEITDYKVVVGNIGIILQLLSQKEIEERVTNYLIESLEQFGKENHLESVKSMEDGLKKLGVGLDVASGQNAELVNAVKQLPEEQAKKVVAWVIQTIYETTEGSRNANEVAQNLLGKIKRDEQADQIRETIDFIGRLTRIKGKPASVLTEVEALIHEYKLDAKPIAELKEIANYLDCQKIDWNKVNIDFGFGRGLQYYTGMIFEINVHSDRLGLSQKQVCGGGRYDGLIHALGNPYDIPALGFSFGLERLLLCMPEIEAVGVRLDAFIAPIGKDNEFREGVKLTAALRRAGLRVDIGSKGLAPRDLTGMAKRLRSRYVVFIGSDEIMTGNLSVKNLETGKQTKCSLDEALKLISTGKNNI